MVKRNNKKRKIIEITKNKLFNLFKFLGTKTWFFTMLFFVAVLVASVWIWWQCVYHPEPSVTVREKIEREREDFDSMKKKTMETIALLQEYRDNYNNAPNFENQRELFIDLLDQEVIDKMVAGMNEDPENERGTQDLQEEIFEPVSSEEDSSSDALIIESIK